MIKASIPSVTKRFQTCGETSLLLLLSFILKLLLCFCFMAKVQVFSCPLGFCDITVIIVVVILKRKSYLDLWYASSHIIVVVVKQNVTRRNRPISRRADEHRSIESDKTFDWQLKHFFMPRISFMRLLWARPRPPRRLLRSLALLCRWRCRDVSSSSPSPGGQVMDRWWPRPPHQLCYIERKMCFVVLF